MDKINLQLDINQINAIFTALTDQPYKTVAKLINDLDEQVKSQIQPKTEGPLSDKLL